MTTFLTIFFVTIGIAALSSKLTHTRAKRLERQEMLTRVFYTYRVR